MNRLVHPSKSYAKEIRTSDQDLRALLAEIVQPLQAEVAELKERLARGTTKRSQFDISLTHIPPEVEEKLWIRLRQDLGAQVLQQTRQQSEQVFEATKEAIGKKIREAQNEFRDHVTQQLQTVEQQAQTLSEEITGAVSEHLRSGADGSSSKSQRQETASTNRVRNTCVPCSNGWAKNMPLIDEKCRKRRQPRQRNRHDYKLRSPVWALVSPSWTIAPAASNPEWTPD